MILCWLLGGLEAYPSIDVINIDGNLMIRPLFSGIQVHHTFLRPGFRSVVLRVYDQGRLIGKISQKVHVHPCWWQRATRVEKIFKQQWTDLMMRNFFQAPPEDLLYFSKFLSRITAPLLLDKFANACYLRRDLVGKFSELFYHLGCTYRKMHPVDHFLTRKAFEKFLKLNSNVQLKHKANLRLADLLLNYEGRKEEGEKVLLVVDTKFLNKEERALQKFLKVDSHILKGEIAEARRILKPWYSRPLSALQTVRRRTFLERAKDFIRRNEYNAARDIILAILQKNPRDRLNPEILQLLILHQSLPEKISSGLYPLSEICESGNHRGSPISIALVFLGNKTCNGR